MYAITKLCAVQDERILCVNVIFCTARHIFSRQDTVFIFLFLVTTIHNSSVFFIGIAPQNFIIKLLDIVGNKTLIYLKILSNKNTLICCNTKKKQLKAK